MMKTSLSAAVMFGLVPIGCTRVRKPSSDVVSGTIESGKDDNHLAEQTT